MLLELTVAKYKYKCVVEEYQQSHQHPPLIKPENSSLNLPELRGGHRFLGLRLTFPPQHRPLNSGQRALACVLANPPSNISFQLCLARTALHRPQTSRILPDKKPAYGSSLGRERSDAF